MAYNSGANEAWLKRDWGWHVPAHMLTWTALFSVPAARLARIFNRAESRSHPFTKHKFDSSILVLICCHNRLPMSCPASEEIDAAPPPPGCSTPPQDESNGGAAHAESDAERMETESGPHVEKQFDESTGNLAWKMFSTFGWNGSIHSDSLSSRLHCLVPYSLLMFCVQWWHIFRADYLQRSLKWHQEHFGTRVCKKWCISSI